MILKIYDRIRVRTLSFFNEFKVNLKYDSIASTFSFKFYFDPNNIEHKEMACIGHYHICTLEHNGEVIVKGNMLSESFVSSPTRQMNTISGYSLPGVLEDCNIVPGALPDLFADQRVSFNPSLPNLLPTLSDQTPQALQFDNLSLNQIVDRCIAPFAITRVTDPIVSKICSEEKYTETNCKIGEGIRPFLARLAAQKNVILSHNAFGNIVLTRLPAYQTPVYNFDGNIPNTTMTLSFDGQRMHSHIKVVEQADIDNPLSETTSEVRNPYVIGSVYRPKVVVLNSRTTTNDAQDSANNLLAQELKGITLTISLDRWEVTRGKPKVFRPGMVITVKNPEVYLYNKSTWMIEEVNLSGTSDKLTCDLVCKLPECYNNQTPTYLWKGINLH